MHAGKRVVPLYAKLSDKFGDYGLISVVIIEFADEHAEITSWLMSCRVLARGVEERIMNEVIYLAKSRGISLVIGRYIPTTKNHMVKDFYGRFGFKPTYCQSTGAVEWRLDISSYQHKNVHILDKKGDAL
jgi:FkbH-like protein